MTLHNFQKHIPTGMLYPNLAHSTQATAAKGAEARTLFANTFM